MMDSTKIIPKGFHPQCMWTTDGVKYDLKWKHRSSVGPINYYIIDFRLSTWFRYQGQTTLSIGVYGQDKTVPELSDTIPYNPFKVDIYQLGGVLNKLCDIRDLPFLTVFHADRFIRRLIQAFSTCSNHWQGK